jgi:hypothetical protein
MNTQNRALIGGLKYRNQFQRRLLLTLGYKSLINIEVGRGVKITPSLTS